MTEFVEKRCPICGVQYCLEQEYWAFRQRGGLNEGRKASWYCPNGHNLIITDSEADKLRRERDRLQQCIAEKDDRIADVERQLTAQKGQVTKLKKRAAAGTCPCCQRSFSNMTRHMKTQHPEYANEAANIVPLKRPA